MGFRNIHRLIKEAYVNGERFELTSSDTLLLRPHTNDTGAINVGDGTYDMDVKWFGGASGDYVLLDVGNARAQFEDIDVLLNDANINLGDNDDLTFGDGDDAQLKWNGTYLEHGPASGLWAGAPSEADPQYHTIAHVFFDDFYKAPVDANGVWTEVDDGGTGTNATADGAGGIGTVVTAGADNDYHAITSTNECFKFATGKKLWFEARFKLAEATTNESAWWFGLTDTLTTGGLQAHAAGPLASYDGFLIWKDEATLKVDSELSEAGDQDTDTEEADFVSNKWSRVGFYYDGATTITPYYEMNEAGSWTAGTAKAFDATIALASMDEMHVVAGVKAGPSGAAETLQIDYIKVVQLR